MDKTKIQFIITLLAVAVLFFLFSHKEGTDALPPNGVAGVAEVVVPFDNLRLEAKSAYVFDIAEDKPIFELNPEAQLPLASLTKIMTVVVAKELMPESAFASAGGVVDIALAHSSNEAAAALALMASDYISSGSFLDFMNNKAKELDLRQTYFLNETGLDVSQNMSGAYGSAFDIVTLMKYAVENNPGLFEGTQYAQIGAISNTNIYAASTTQLVASKTGFTDLAGGNLAIIFDAGFYHPVAVVVLGSSKEGRFSDIQKLIDATFEYLRK
jgi:D-alanyl-D-alanine carboxypeptidase (penicillin-binding protein 5/6)